MCCILYNIIIVYCTAEKKKNFLVHRARARIRYLRIYVHRERARIYFYIFYIFSPFQTRKNNAHNIMYVINKMRIKNKMEKDEINIFIFLRLEEKIITINCECMQYGEQKNEEQKLDENSDTQMSLTKGQLNGGFGNNWFGWMTCEAYVHRARARIRYVRIYDIYT